VTAKQSFRAKRGISPETVPRAIVLLSGGLDSATCFLIAKQEAGQVFALSFDYGQRHRVELDRARALAARYGAAGHRTVRLDHPAPEGSALTDFSREIPSHALGREPIPPTYVPARNTLFLAYAVAWGEVIGAADVFIGANALDYSGYPDCRPEFLESFERTVNLGTKAGAEGSIRFRIHAPLIAMSKGEIVTLAARLGLDFALTSSCYDPSPEGVPCGGCDSCLLRAKGFQEAGLRDPLGAP
jgi:7-cyano-7-deazaguanine synthase